MTGEKKNSKGVVLLIGCAVVIIALLAVIIVLLLSRNDTGSVENSNLTQSEAPKRDVLVTKDNVEEMVSELASEAREYIEPGYYAVSMETEWHFATGDAVSEDAIVQNIEENTNDVYFDIFIEGNEEEAIYQSPIIPRGAVLEGIALDKPLEAGTYNCVMVYHLVNEEQETLSTLRVAFRIIVES